MTTTIAEAGRQFREYLEGQGLAPKTVQNQSGCILGRTGFLAACQRAKKTPTPTMGQIDHSCVTEYFRSHVGTTGTRNNKLDTLTKFLHWAGERKMLRPGFTADGLLSGQAHKRRTKKPKLYLPAEDFPALLDAAGKHSERDRAAVALVLYTLGRQSEISAILLKHLNLEARTLRLWREKTDRWTETGISEDLAEEMETWLAWYADHTGYGTDVAGMIADHPDWHLVPATCRGAYWLLAPENPIGKMEDLFKRALTKMGFSDEELIGAGAHTGRRSGARELYKHLKTTEGRDHALVSTQAVLDHVSVKQTQDYIDMDNERDEMNNWLRTNRMYGQRGVQPPKSNVVPVDFSRRRGA